MNRLTLFFTGAVFAVPLGVARAQTAAPQHLDNIWGGQAHQPTEAEVTQQEQAAHAGLTQQQQQLSDDQLQSIYRELMESNAPAGE